MCHGNGILFKSLLFYSYQQFFHQLSRFTYFELLIFYANNNVRRLSYEMILSPNIKNKTLRDESRCNIFGHALRDISFYSGTMYCRRGVCSWNKTKWRKVQEDLTAYNLEWYTKMVLKFITRILLSFLVAWSFFRLNLLFQYFSLSSTCGYILIWSEKIVGSLM